MCKCVKTDPKCKYFIGNMCTCVRDVCRFFENVNISFEICVNVFQLIQNINISIEICANVFGSPMDAYKDPKQINISFEICVNVFQLI